MDGTYFLVGQHVYMPLNYIEFNILYGLNATEFNILHIELL
jgi:hypothetical protein